MTCLRRERKKVRYCTETQLIACLVVIALESMFFGILTWDGMNQELSMMPLFGVEDIFDETTASRRSMTTTATTTTKVDGDYRRAITGPVRRSSSSSQTTDEIPPYDGSVERTIQILISMGVHPDELQDHSVIPPWSQIVQNFGTSDEPIILGLEHCQAYRDATPFEDRAVAPAGMFSTGTNVFQDLMALNCLSPEVERRNSPLRFNLHQAPWGKHNPAESRLVHSVKSIRKYMTNHTSVLPVVAIRHPLTWMLAMCKHSYGARWSHRKDECNVTVNLHEPIKYVPYGARLSIPDLKTNYTSLAHMWKEWYYPYYQASDFNRLMIRLEDIIFRPQAVITTVCDCVGGVMLNTLLAEPGTEEANFVYMRSSANTGQGHGHHRSDLLTAFIKYGQPLRTFYDKFSNTDKRIMKEVFHDSTDHGGIFDTFKYELFI